MPENYRSGDKWKVPYEKWIEVINENVKDTATKIQNPIDVLIATDCLSEGQNLQDCDCVINYDIHWNPVRLIQRMGRIDRLGSPNKTVKGINFWAASSFEDFLNLKKRVESRMALMSIVGTELDEDMTPEFQKIVEENPLLPKQAEKMLEQLQVTWDEVETGDDTLGLDDLSLEQFRQELFEFFKKNEEFFKKIPNGVYTGFKFSPTKKISSLPESIIAVLGYPRRPDDVADHVYKEIHLLHQIYGEEKDGARKVLSNNSEILSLLRHHKMQERYVPQSIEKGDQEILKKLANSVEKWVVSQAPTVAVNQIQDLFSGDLSP